MSITNLNQNGWGVCGFVSAIQAACYNGQIDIVEALTDEVTIDKADFNEVSTSHSILYPVIRGFFAQASTALKKELHDFSKQLDPTYGDSVDGMIAKMERDMDMVDETIGIAMNGKAMSELCRYLNLSPHEFHGTTATTNKPSFVNKNTIYGIRFDKRIKGRIGFFAGLQHWVYADNDKNLYTWGGLMTPDVKAEIKEITHYLPL